MRLRFSLASALLLSSAPASAQTFQLPPYLGMQLFVPAEQMKRPRECDARGCYFDDLNRWRALQEKSQRPLQDDLQRRAEELHEMLEGQR